MIDTRKVSAAGAVTWALVGGAISLSQLPAVNDDAVVPVTFFSVLGPALAVAAASSASRRAPRAAGALLIVSALATPTYFAYPLNLLAVIAGLWLVATAHGRTGRHRPEPT